MNAFFESLGAVALHRGYGTFSLRGTGLLCGAVLGSFHLLVFSGAGVAPVTLYRVCCPYVY